MLWRSLFVLSFLFCPLYVWSAKLCLGPRFYTPIKLQKNTWTLFQPITITITKIWPLICSVCPNYNSVLSSLRNYYLVCNKSNTMGHIGGSGTAFTSRELRFTPGFLRDLCCSSFQISVLCSLFCLSSSRVFSIQILSVSLDCSFLISNFRTLWFEPTGIRTHDLEPHSRRAHQPVYHQCGSYKMKISSSKHTLNELYPR
jgi:hypothetical protein